MQRMSARLVAAMAGVKCPACGRMVLPELSQPAPSGEAPAAGATRWSFVWRKPGGHICPECLYPFERYERRAKWIRVFTAGAVLLIIEAILLMLGRQIGGLVHDAGVVRTVLRVVGWTGVALLVVGLAGFIIGGRRVMR